MNLRGTTQRPCIAWITLLVVLFQALLPLAGHAGSRAGAGSLPDARRTHWVEICGASGVVRIQRPLEGVDAAAGGPATPSDDGGAAHKHCPACTLHEPLPGVPTAAFPAFLVPPYEGMLPVFQRPVPAEAVWRVARSRAPPNPT
jgi:hypothetical protein